MKTNRCICVLYISKLQTTCWKWEMAEFSKISPFFLWNKLRRRVTRANAWKQYEVDREFIISNWFSMSCCKHTPGNILKIFGCKSLGIEPSQTGRGSPWVEWWNPGCVFLAPLTHFHPPHTHTLPTSGSPAGSQKVPYSAEMWERGTAWGQKGAERRQAIIPANFPFLCLLPKRSHVSTWLSLSLSTSFFSTRELYCILKTLENP